MVLTLASLMADHQKSNQIRHAAKINRPLSHPLCITGLKEYLSPTVILALECAMRTREWRGEKMSFSSFIIIIIALYFDLYIICFP